MPARLRTNNYAVAAGTATWHDGTLTPKPSGYSVDEWCSDIVGNYGGDNPFHLTRTCNLAWSMFGRSKPSGGWNYNGYCRTSPAGAHLPPSSSEPSDNEALSYALARTNPNRPEIDLPVFLFELADIPKTLRFLTELGFKKFRRQPVKTVAEGYLNYEFGVAPFLRDIFSMMDFTNSVEKRLRELRNLQSNKKGLGRGKTAWETDEVFAPWTTVATPLYQENNVLSAVWHTRYRKWCTTRWVPTTDITTLSDEDLRARANRIVFGTDFSFATLWEAMPWSWLIDWFTNVGDIVANSRNTIPVTHERSCIMKSIITRLESVKIVSGSGLSTATVKASKIPTRVDLNRTPWSGSLTPEFTLPFLNGKQLAILGAIGVTRR